MRVQHALTGYACRRFIADRRLPPREHPLTNSKACLLHEPFSRQLLLLPSITPSVTSRIRVVICTEPTVRTWTLKLLKASIGACAARELLLYLLSLERLDLLQYKGSLLPGRRRDANGHGNCRTRGHVNDSILRYLPGLSAPPPSFAVLVGPARAHS